MLLAYIDPGLGSLILQGALAFALSLGVVLRRWWLAPLALLWPRRGEADAPPGHTD